MITGEKSAFVYDDVIFRQALKDFLDQGLLDCSRTSGKQKQRFDLQYDQEKNCKDRVKYLEKVFGNLSGKKILEIGSGSGGLAVAMAMSGAEAFGIEPDPKGLAVCMMRKNRYPGIDLEFREGSAERIPFAGGQFDFVFLISVLEHTQNPQLSLAEIHRVLKVDGVCFIDTPNRLWPIEPHYRVFLPPFLPKFFYKIYLKLRHKNPEEIDRINFFTAGYLGNMLRKTGFEDVKNFSVAEMTEKINNPGSINNLMFRKTFALFEKLKLHRILLLMLRFIIYLGCYPTIRLSARKNSV